MQITKIRPDAVGMTIKSLSNGRLCRIWHAKLREAQERPSLSDRFNKPPAIAISQHRRSVLNEDTKITCVRYGDEPYANAQCH